MELEAIRQLAMEEKIEVTRYVQLRLYQRDIKLEQVVEAIKVGK